jgi:hypothetical protein
MYQSLMSCPHWSCPELPAVPGEVGVLRRDPPGDFGGLVRGRTARATTSGRRPSRISRAVFLPPFFVPAPAVPGFFLIGHAFGGHLPLFFFFSAAVHVGHFPPLAFFSAAVHVGGHVPPLFFLTAAEHVGGHLPPLTFFSAVVHVAGHFLAFFIAAVHLGVFGGHLPPLAFFCAAVHVVFPHFPAFFIAAVHLGGVVVPHLPA